MTKLLRADEGAMPRRGTWLFQELHNTSVDHPKGTLLPVIICPLCGAEGSLMVHDIALDGRVTTSVKCSRESEGCTFHDNVELCNYAPMGDHRLAFAAQSEGAAQVWRGYFRQWFTEFPKIAGGRFAGYGGYGDGEPNGTAASWESMRIFESFIRGRGRILNAGAGASSWMLRRWYGERVTCLDNVPDYLHAVRATCRAHGLPGDDYRWGAENLPECDYCFYDYGEWMDRGSGLEACWAKTRHGMYVDDADDRECNEGWRRMVVKFAMENGIRKIDFPDKADKWGRWGCMFLRV